MTHSCSAFKFSKFYKESLSSLQKTLSCKIRLVIIAWRFAQNSWRIVLLLILLQCGFLKQILLLTRLYSVMPPPLETTGTAVLMILYWYHSIAGCDHWLFIIWLGIKLFVINWFAIKGFIINWCGIISFGIIGLVIIWLVIIWLFIICGHWL